jgi:hypothetical protein
MAPTCSILIHRISQTRSTSRRWQRSSVIYEPRTFCCNISPHGFRHATLTTRYNKAVPPSPYGRTFIVAVFVFVLAFSPYAHAAETSPFGINDPFVDAVQLWSTVFSSLDSLGNQLVSLLQLHQTLTFTRSTKPHAPKILQQPAALAASAALATQSLPETATNSGSASDTLNAQQHRNREVHPEQHLIRQHNQRTSSTSSARAIRSRGSRNALAYLSTRSCEPII